MYPSKTPLLLLLQSFGVVLASIAVCYWCDNALGILGLFFMPTVPLMPNPADIGAREEEEEGDYQGTTMGFTSEK